MSASILVVGGAGFMGSRAVRSLLDDGHEVTVGDLRPSDVIGAGYVEVDATDADSIERAARDADVIMNFAGPYYVLGDTVARVAVKLGKPYIDICDDAEATEELLQLDSAAKESGARLIIGAGSSPGILNALSLRIVEGMDEVDELVTTWVVGEKGPSGPAPLRHFLFGISHDIPVWRDGGRAMVPAFSEESGEEFPFPEPVGTMVVRDVGHPEPVTLPQVIKARSVRNKGALLPRQSTEIYDLFRHLDLIGDRTVKVNGTDVVARDFIAEFLTQRHNERARDSSGDVMGLGVRVTGTVGGRQVERWLAGGGHMTMADATALPTAAAVPQLLEGAVPVGAHGPEALDVTAWFKELVRIKPDLYGTIRLWEDGNDPVTLTLGELADVEDITATLGAAA